VILELQHSTYRELNTKRKKLFFVKKEEIPDLWLCYKFESHVCNLLSDSFRIDWLESMKALIPN